MIWVKTDAGRAELQHRTHLHDRHLRAVLVLVDGKKLEDGLLRTLPGSSPEDLKELQRLGLIEPLSAVAGAGSHTTAAPGVPSAALPARNVSPEQFEALTAELRRVISAHLGLGGLSLTLALEQARTTEDSSRWPSEPSSRLKDVVGQVPPRKQGRRCGRCLTNESPLVVVLSRSASTRLGYCASPGHPFDAAIALLLGSFPLRRRHPRARHCVYGAGIARPTGSTGHSRGARDATRRIDFASSRKYGIDGKRTTF